MGETPLSARTETGGTGTHECPEERIMTYLAVNRAPDRNSGTKHLLDGALELLGPGFVAHNAGNLVDVLHGDVPVVGDVLLLRMR